MKQYSQRLVTVLGLAGVLMAATILPSSADDTDPMTPMTAPSLTISASTVTCAAGTFSQDATYAAYSLLVDGAPVATSTTDDSLPQWLIPNLAETVATNAALDHATFTWNTAWVGKSLQCVELAYANHATGLIYSAELQGK